MDDGAPAGNAGRTRPGPTTARTRARVGRLVTRAGLELAALLRATGPYATHDPTGSRAATRGLPAGSAAPPPVPQARLALVVATAGALHGAVMGSFAGPLGALYSAAKIPLLLGLAPLVCVPSFRVVHAVLGLADDEPAARRAVLCSQATLALTLLALSPLLVVAYASSSRYHVAKLVNVGVFALAALAGQLTLARHYRPLLRKDRRHRLALVVWPTLHLFVALQLAYALRPFVGNPRFPTEFLRSDWMGNVYLDLLWSLRATLG